MLPSPTSLPHLRLSLTFSELVSSLLDTSVISPLRTLRLGRDFLSAGCSETLAQDLMRFPILKFLRLTVDEMEVSLCNGAIPISVDMLKLARRIVSTF